MSKSVYVTSQELFHASDPPADSELPGQTRSYLLRLGRHHRPLRRSFLSAHQCAVRHANRCLQPSFDVQQHPFAVRVPPHRPHQEFWINFIEETLDVEIKHPVITPAALAGYCKRLMCGAPGSISIGVFVEHRLQDSLQISLHHHLGDSVRNRRYPERPGPPIALRYVHPAHGWRVVTPSSSSDSRSDRGSCLNA